MLRGPASFRRVTRAPATIAAVVLTAACLGPAGASAVPESDAPSSGAPDEPAPAAETAAEPAPPTRERHRGDGPEWFHPQHPPAGVLRAHTLPKGHYALGYAYEFTRYDDLRNRRDPIGGRELVETTGYATAPSRY